MKKGSIANLLKIRNQILSTLGNFILRYGNFYQEPLENCDFSENRHCMQKIEMNAENDKTTKNHDRFKFDHEDISGSVYLPKGTNKAKVTVEFE